jgi:hypothetical protein
MFSRKQCLILLLAFLFPHLPLQANTRLIFPRVLFQQGRWSGIAVANPTGSSAAVVFKAWTTGGVALSGTGVTNPSTQQIKSGSQYVKLATEIFLPGGVPAEFNGTTPVRVWVEATSTTDGLTGFYLEGDGGNFMDGSDLSGSGTDLIIPIVENTSGSVTEINLVNPDTSAANITLTFYREDGSSVATRSTTLPASGALQGPLSTAFADVDYSQVHGVKIHADVPVACSASIFGSGSGSLMVIAGENVQVPAKTLYFPQLAEGAGWSTAVGVQNMQGADVLVTLTAYDSDGKLFAPPTVKENPVTQTIKGWGILHAKLSDPNLQHWFGFATTDLKAGWLKVEASSSAINGFVEYSAGNNRALVPAQLTSYSKAIFSYQVQSSGYFTGVAILNPGSLTTNVEITSLRGDAAPHGKTQIVLKPGQKVSKLLYELVSASSGAANGSVFVKSDSATVATQLFGTSTFAALSNIAPQEVTTTWDPGASIQKLSLSPQLAVVETGKTKAYTIDGVTEGASVAWSSDPGIGTLSSTGAKTASYLAPSNKPESHSITLMATADTRCAGATVDVVQREQLISGLTLLTAVAYLENLQRFFIAEQQVLSSAPSIHYAAGGSNTRISLVNPGSSSPVLIKTVSGDTIAKMIPFSDGGKNYLILAGYDTGSIYRLEILSDFTGGNLVTVATGLNKPTSLAFDPVTGNLLVAELAQISVVQRSQLTAASSPDFTLPAPTPGPRRLPALSVALPQGIAVDRCTGAIYAALGDGTLREYLGNTERFVVRGLNKPRQLQVIYRDGLSCSNGLALAVAEATQVTLVYPLTGRTEALVSAPNVQDLTFFPHDNPYVKNGEASFGLAEAPAGTGASQISKVTVGGMYQAAAPTPIATSTQTAGDPVVPYSDPAGDTFATSTTSSGNRVPDILSVTSTSEGSNRAISITFSFPVVPYDSTSGSNPPNSIDGIVWLDTQSGGNRLQELSQYQGLGASTDFVARYAINLSTREIIDFIVTGDPYYHDSTYLPVNYLGDTVVILVPVSYVLDPTKVRLAVLVKNQSEYTDIAPNAGAIRVVPK